MIIAAALLALQLQGLERLQELGGTGSATDIRVVNNQVRKTIPCNKNAVYLMGNDGTFTITGVCTNIFVRGNHNKVNVQRSATISVEGNNNSVAWQDRATKASNPGNGNTLLAPR